MRKSLICSAAFIFTILTFGTLFADKTYKDSSTGLFWYYRDARHTWQNALAYCEGLTAEGYNDWRLPNKNEIATIMLNRSFLNGDQYFWTSTSNSTKNAHCLEPVLINFNYYFDFAAVGCPKANSTTSGKDIDVLCVR